jgi:hypothetical protein
MDLSKSHEVGRELLAHELTVKTVVVIGRDDRPFLVTTWVRTIGEDFVEFFHGEVNTAFLVCRQGDGTLTDDTGRRIHVWEYLGVV